MGNVLHKVNGHMRYVDRLREGIAGRLKCTCTNRDHETGQVMNQGEGSSAREAWGMHDECAERWTLAWGTQGTSTTYAIGCSEAVA